MLCPIGQSNEKPPLQALAKWWEHVTPWSVINYFSNGCEPRAYWLSTSNNDIIGEILGQADQTICEQLAKLLQGESIFTFVDTSVIYPQIRKNPSSIYSFLLVCGYLKTVEQGQPFGAGVMCHVALPNKEIRFVYQSEEKHYDEKLRQEGVTKILKYGVAFSGKEVAISTPTQ